MDVWSSRKSRLFGPATWLVVAVLAAVAGCSTYSGLRLGTTPKSYLRHVRSNPDPNIRFVAYSKLGHRDFYDDPADLSEAVKTMTAKLEEGKEPKAIQAVIINSLGDLGDRRARGAIAKIANNPNTEPMLKVEAFRALGKVGKPEDAMTLVRLWNTEQLEDCRIAAIEAIGDLKVQDPRIYHVLIEGMEHEDPAIRLQSYRALKQITGKDVGNRAQAWRRELEPQLAGDQKSPTAAPAPDIKKR